MSERHVTADELLETIQRLEAEYPNATLVVLLTLASSELELEPDELVPLLIKALKEKE